MRFLGGRLNNPTPSNIPPGPPASDTEVSATKPRRRQPALGEGQGPAGTAGAPLVPPGVKATPASSAAPAPSGVKAAPPSPAAGPKAQVPPAIKVSKPVSPMRALGRHRIVAASFVAAIILPVVLTAFYLWAIAANQYASYVSFVVRSENQASAMELMGGLAALTGSSSSSDAEVLYAFFQSQDLVNRIDEDVDLRTIWSKPSFDPIFAYDAPGEIEDLTDYWQKMVQLTFDSATGIIDIRVLAFDPADAQRIATAIYSEGSAMINQLSDIAREDAIRYAREDLDTAQDKLREARAGLTTFRNANQIVDPSMDTMGQMGILNTLQTELATAMVDLDMLRETTREGDTRITQAQSRISVIERRITEERGKLGMAPGANDGSAFADLVGDYERLTVDREFAEQSYTVALVAFNAAQADAGRQSRYLAAHVSPTLAQKSQFPQRGTTLALVTLFLLLVWGVAVLVGYSLKDRR